jgi:phospholipid N-methyltransferase
MQKVLNETFQAAFIMNSGQFVLDSSILVKGQNVLQNLLSDVPFVSTILYVSGAITDNVLSNVKRGKFRYLQIYVPDLIPLMHLYSVRNYLEGLLPLVKM